MSFRLLVACAVLLVLAGCGRWRNRSVAGIEGLGREWVGAAGQLRLAVNNGLKREVVVYVDASGTHLKLTVGPAGQRHLIVPSAKYRITCYYSDGDEVGNNYIHTDDRNGIPGLLLDIDRP